MNKWFLFQRVLVFAGPVLENVCNVIFYLHFLFIFFLYFFINAELQVGNSYECFYIVFNRPREKLLRGPDVLTAMGSFPLPPCTDVHQVLIPRSHTRTSNICTHCTTRHNHTQIQIDISAPKHGHDYVERVPWVHITLLLVDIWVHSWGITRDY